MVNGLLLVDKPAGWTSHDVVAKVRNILRQEILLASHVDAVQASQEERVSRRSATVSERQTSADTAMRQKPAGVSGSAGQQGKAVRRLKVGHTGTLDPFATGLLMLVIGSYTKRAGEFSKLDKTYEAELTLGSTSTTGDLEGKITSVSGEVPTENQIKNAIAQFIGNIEQTPHQYSAVKVGGQRAYKLAREGKTPQLEPRKVTIYEIRIAKYEYPKLCITARVSSGTYIRSLAEDIGAKLGTGAYLSALRRAYVGKYSVEDAQDLQNIGISAIIR